MGTVARAGEVLTARAWCTGVPGVCTCRRGRRGSVRQGAHPCQPRPRRSRRGLGRERDPRPAYRPVGTFREYLVKHHACADLISPRSRGLRVRRGPRSELEVLPSATWAASRAGLVVPLAPPLVAGRTSMSMRGHILDAPPEQRCAKNVHTSMSAARGRSMTRGRSLWRARVQPACEDGRHVTCRRGRQPLCPSMSLSSMKAAP